MVREGYAFLGWYFQPNGQGGIVTATTALNSSVTVYAFWAPAGVVVPPPPPPETVIISFNPQGGSLVASSIVNKGAALGFLPAAPTRTGFVFKGWFMQPNGQGGEVTTATVFSANTEVFAHWANAYLVSFNSQGGASVSAVYVEGGKTFTAPPEPTQNGFTFEQWYKEAACTNAWNFETDVVTAGVTLYAKWEIFAFTLINNGTEYAVSKIAGNAYEGLNITLPSTFRGISVTEVSSNGFALCKMIGVTFSSSIVKIGNSAFSRCNNLKNIVIPDTVTSVGTSAFAVCEALESVTLSANLESIGTGAFLRCTALTTVIIPSGLETLGEGMFLDCTALTSITIPASVTTINTAVFSRCTSLVVTMLAEEPPTIQQLCFNGVVAILVPAGKTGVYKAAWPEYADIIGEELCTVTFDSQGGSSVDEKRAAKNGLLTAPPEPTQNGFTFEQWYKEPACINAWNFETDIVTADITLYAKWEMFGYAFYIDDDGETGYTAYVNDIDNIYTGDLVIISTFRGLPVIQIMPYGFAFINSINATSITIPASVKEIGACAFMHCTNLVVIMQSAEPPKQNESFEKVAAILVPAGKTGVYKAAWPEYADIIVEDIFAGGAYGQGTQESPYIISTYEQLLAMRLYPAAHFELGANIDLAGKSFRPIFSMARPFEGVFDGNGHTISNLTIDYDGNYGSLFGVAGASSTIKNLYLTDFSILIPTQYNGGWGNYTYTGSLCGVTFGNVENITANGTITGTGIYRDRIVVGGLLGAAAGQTKNCSIVVDIDLAMSYRSDLLYAYIVGGLIGSGEGDVLDCTAEGSISVTAQSESADYYGGQIGGLVGAFYFDKTSGNAPAQITITNCHANVDINCPGALRVGGFVAYIGSNATVFKITNCTASGDINGYMAAGFVCDFFGDEGSFFHNCSATGMVNGEYVAAGFVFKTQIDGFGLGGTSVQKMIEFIDCFATGSVCVDGYGNAGGFAVSLYYSYVNKCYATGNVVSLNGGAAGFSMGTYEVNLYGCYAKGNVTGRAAAGFCVSINFGEVTRCYALGNVNGTTTASGFAWFVLDLEISECFATGDVSGSEQLAGFIFDLHGTVNNCYSTSDIFVDANGSKVVYAGGFVGQNLGYEGEAVIITNCYYYGTISFEGTVSPDFAIGGFIGYMMIALKPDALYADNCHWFAFDGSPAIESIGFIYDDIVTPDHCEITMHAAGADMDALAALLNAGNAQQVWESVGGNPPQLLFELE